MNIKNKIVAIILIGIMHCASLRGLDRCCHTSNKITVLNDSNKRHPGTPMLIHCGTEISERYVKPGSKEQFPRARKMYINLPFNNFKSIFKLNGIPNIRYIRVMTIAHVNAQSGWQHRIDKISIVSADGQIFIRKPLKLKGES